MNPSQRLVSKIPLIALTLLSSYTVMAILISAFNYHGKLHFGNFNLNHYLAFTTVVLCWMLYAVNHRIGILTLTGILILGTFSFVNFLPNEYIFTGTLTWKESFTIGIDFQPLSFSFLLLNLIINKSTHFEFYNKYFKSPESDTSLREIKRDPLIDVFKSKFRGKSTDELKDIAGSGGQFQVAAIIAAKELLAEKNSK